MTGFLFALIAVMLASIGARDQILVASLAARFGQRPALLVLAIVLSTATAAFAGWVSIEVAPMLNPDARMLFAAIALAFGGAESLVLSPGRKPQEPTRSLAATAIVLLSHQAIDAARFLIFALAVATGAPLPAGAGGAIGGAIMLGAAWAAPELFDWRRLRWVRRTIGVILLLAACIAGFRVLG
jgi:Ca2+/H+ antiporter, TMEM165/GDT1 family